MHRCYFVVDTRVQLDDPISRVAAIQFWQFASRNELPNDEDEILSGSAAAHIVIAHIVTWYASYGSGRNARKQHSAPADVQVRGPRGRGAAFERRLHDRPRSKPMRRADVDLWQPRRARAIQECVLTLTSTAAPDTPRAMLVGQVASAYGK